MNAALPLSSPKPLPIPVAYTVSFRVPKKQIRTYLIDNAEQRTTAGGTGKMTWKQVAERALKELSETEQRSGAVYVDEVVLAPGSTLKVDHNEVPVRRPSAVVFIDKQPQVNWGHPCRYLLVGLEDGKVESIEAQFPPFLRGVPKTLRLIWKGETVPDWAIATQRSD
jgi:hypothetical protein